MDSLMTWKFAFPMTNRMLGRPLGTASPPPNPLYPVAAKATLPAKPVKNTRRANMVVVL